MAENRRSGKLAVILHADVAGSTGLVQQDMHLAHERIQATLRYAYWGYRKIYELMKTQDIANSCERVWLIRRREGQQAES